MLEHDAPAATQIGDAMQTHAERVVDHLYERVLQAFGVLFLAVLLIVLISRLLGALLARAGCKKNLCGGQGGLIWRPNRGAGHAKMWPKQGYIRRRRSVGRGLDVASNLSRGSEGIVADRCLGSDK